MSLLLGILMLSILKKIYTWARKKHLIIKLLLGLHFKKGKALKVCWPQGGSTLFGTSIRMILSILGGIRKLLGANTMLDLESTMFWSTKPLKRLLRLQLSEMISLEVIIALLKLSLILICSNKHKTKKPNQQILKLRTKKLKRLRKLKRMSIE